MAWFQFWHLGLLGIHGWRQLLSQLPRASLYLCLLIGVEAGSRWEGRKSKISIGGLILILRQDGEVAGHDLIWPLWRGRQGYWEGNHRLWSQARWVQILSWWPASRVALTSVFNLPLWSSTFSSAHWGWWYSHHLYSHGTKSPWTMVGHQ